ncbi:hypothetical protein [Ruegeria arenilitoris]|uniref:hypothetical protein n=1 Tax=Ruegeria arenilitoris TaxID=1173585 RepID=UPI00147B0E6B|nr:hypothetical protein [Ruegeria arenilitoris]
MKQKRASRRPFFFGAASTQPMFAMPNKAVIPIDILLLASAFIYSRRMDNEVLRYTSPDGQQSLILDDDGKTGYAYLLDEGGKVTADCWLYNRKAAPVENEWKFSKNMPFANSAEYVKPEFTGGFNPPKNDGELSVGWTDQGAELFIRDRLFARLVVGSKPGWSRLAAKDGPLALMLSD